MAQRSLEADPQIESQGGTEDEELNLNPSDYTHYDDENDETSAIFDKHLSKSYYYQHSTTGNTSTTPLTARQLCLILSPATESNNSIIHAGTLAIEWDSESQSYSSEGWLPCRRIPVLREACANWHYQDTATGEIRGPVPTRVLAAVLHSGRNKIRRRSAAGQKYLVDEGQDAIAIDGNTKVWSAEIAADAQQMPGTENEAQQATQWRPILQDLYLRISLHAFHQHPHRACDVKSTGPTDVGSQLLQAFDLKDMVYTEKARSAADAPGAGRTAAADASFVVSSVGTSIPSKQQQKIIEELEEFLASTARDGDDDDDHDAEGYESDGGTHYVRDGQNGQWRSEGGISTSDTTSRHGAKPQPQQSRSSSNISAQPGNSKKRKKKAKFNAKNAAKWIYVTGLPKDTNEDEVREHFARAGIIDLDPETQHPRVKLYHHKNSDEAKGIQAGDLKGDASICYAREESVELAVQLLDEAFFRPTSSTPDGRYPLSVTRAKFEQKGDIVETSNKPRIAEAKRKVAKLAAMQAIDWDEGDNGRITGGLKGLRIIVLKHMFTLELLQRNEDAVLDNLQKQIHRECSELGSVEKITIFSKNPEGVVIVKFVQPAAATEAVKQYHGKVVNGQKVDAGFWDGVTDFTAHDDNEYSINEKRLEEFGQWLENQELPEEFRLRLEGEQ